MRMNYMKGVLDWSAAHPDKTVLFDTETEKEMSYSELDELTSRIYGYLADRGIAREDFVMIDLPRGINVAVAAIGVWRAGAAYVIVEEGTPDARKEYIYQDCECRLLIDQETYAQMLDAPGKEGFEKTDPHDAAYVIYTSGTTGNPKGVVHEYGTLEENTAHFRYEGKNLMGEDDRFLLVTPFPLSRGDGDQSDAIFRSHPDHCPVFSGQGSGKAPCVHVQIPDYRDIFHTVLPEA